MEQAETYTIVVTVTFTRADIVRAEAASDWVAKHLSHSIGDPVFSWHGELPRPYIEQIEALGLAFVGYRSPYREWFEAPNRKRGDVPPAHLSDLIGEFEFSSQEAADRFRAALRSGSITRVHVRPPLPIAHALHHAVPHTESKQGAQGPIANWQRSGSALRADYGKAALATGRPFAFSGLGKEKSRRLAGLRLFKAVGGALGPPLVLRSA